MPNYNISVVVDPSGAVQGVNVVESNLGRLPSKAKAIETAVQRAFDFNTGPAVAGTSAVDKALDGLKTSADNAGNAVNSAMDKAAAAAARANGRIINSNAQVRNSQLQLGQQFNDFATQVVSGGSVVTAFAQQSGQAAFALQGMNGWLGTVGRFLAGPWGTITLVATTVLAGMVSQMDLFNSELDKAVEKLKEDARQTQIDEQAKAIYARTLEGVTEALRKNEEALDKLNDTGKTAARLSLEKAIAAKAELQGIRETTQANIEKARSILAIERASDEGFSANEAIARESRIRERETQLDRLEASLKNIDKSVSKADSQISEALGRRVVEIAEERSTAVGRINAKYEDLIETTRKGATADEIANGILSQKVRRLKELEKAELDAARAAEKRTKVTNDGVARYRSQGQAIGIAGRELQRSGLRVSENEQFGGITPGAHKSSHINAIDVNQGRGIVEANVPDLKARFDELARRYQARGYRVLWNGQVYNAGGSGPSGPIRGSDKHYDHMHLEAPKSIVGRATDAANENQAISEFNREQQIAEQKSDFVTGVVDGAQQRGQGSVASSAEAQTARVFADYKRRFNEELGDADKARVAGAINDAVARETAAYFDEAYVKPLDRLSALQGRTGIDREVLNKQLEERTRLGRELTPVEAQQIENGIRQGDALSRQAEILESIRQPQQDYADRIAALNELLRKGEINQTSFNARVSELGSSARDALGDLPGADPNTGRSYSDIAARGEEEARYARELEVYQNNRAQLLALGLNYDALEVAAKRRHVQNLNNIDRERRSVALLAASDTFNSLADIARDSMGEQSAVYKAMFTVSKAFAIADSIVKIQQGIANALSLPFPANLGAAAAVAAQAASIISNIQAISLNFADGGYVSGPGSSRSDSIPANLSNGEFVVNAAATRSNRALLEAINSGRRPVVASADVSPSSGGSGDGGIHISVGDVIVQGGSGDGQEIGRNVKQALVSIVREELSTQKRSGGALTKQQSSVMSGG